jgi:hypothetical protein
MIVKWLKKKVAGFVEFEKRAIYFEENLDNNWFFFLHFFFYFVITMYLHMKPFTWAVLM